MASSFVHEFPLDCQLFEIHQLDKRLNAGRQLYNACLSEVLRRAQLMRSSPSYQTARTLPVGKQRTEAFKQLRELFSFSEYALHAHLNSLKDCFFSRLLDANTRQTLASRAYRAANQYVLGLRGRPRFKKRSQFSSVEGKTNKSGLMFRTRTFQWLGLRIPVKIDPEEPLALYALSCRVKYVRLVRRSMRGKLRFFMQLILEGQPSKKFKPFFGQGKVGLDVGPSSLAAVGEGCAILEEVAPGVETKQREVRKLQRKLDRQRRANNPHNSNSDGTCKKGHKRWNRSQRMKKTNAKLQDLEWKLAEHRKSVHGKQVSRLLELGDVFHLEKVSYKAWQKRFGKSTQRRGVGLLVERLKRRAESAGGQVYEFATRTTKLSQICQCGHREKKPLSQRIHQCPCGIVAQRDLYSAHLARFVQRQDGKDVFQADQAQQAWSKTDDVLRTAWKQTQTASGGPWLSSFGKPPKEVFSESELFVREELGNLHDVLEEALPLLAWATRQAVKERTDSRKSAAVPRTRRLSPCGVVRKRSSDLLQTYHTHAPTITQAIASCLAAAPQDTPLTLFSKDDPFSEPPTSLAPEASSPSAPPADPAPYKAVLEPLARFLSWNLYKLRHADLLVFRETVEDKAAADDLEKSLKEARDRLIRFRSRFEGIFGEDFASRLGLSGTTPSDPPRLLQYAEAVLSVLRSSSLVLPPPLDNVSPPSKDELLTSLSDALTPLQTALQAWQRETKETQAARLQRQDALQKTQAALSSLSSIMETWARLADLTEIAQRIRPAGRPSRSSSSSESPDP